MLPTGIKYELFIVRVVRKVEKTQKEEERENGNEGNARPVYQTPSLCGWIYTIYTQNLFHSYRKMKNNFSADCLTPRV